MIHSIKEAGKSGLSGKVVFMRGSADVPMDESKDISDITRIKDKTRIDSFFPTLEHLIRSEAKVVLQPGWIDRPEGIEKGKSVMPVYLYIREMLHEKGLIKDEPMLAPSDPKGEIRNIADNFGMIEERVGKLKDGQLLVLENPRFDEGYNKGDEDYARKLASMVDVYVADDFAQRHRPASDIVPMARLVKKRYAGFNLIEEIRYISGVSIELEKKGRRPFVFILAGKKIDTKPGVVSKITVALKLLDRMKGTDSILVGGALAYAFMLAERYAGRVKAGEAEVRKMSIGEIKGVIGESYMKEDQIRQQIMLAAGVMEKAKERGVRIVMPTDNVVTKDGKVMVSGGIPAGWAGIDVGPKTVKEFEKIIMSAGFVVMAGPVGMFDKKPDAESGSLDIAKALGKATKNGVVTVTAGGESTLLVNTAKVKISHASIGGGSTLEFIEKGTLPGIEALDSG